MYKDTNRTQKRKMIDLISMLYQISKQKKNESNKENLISNLIGGEAVKGVKLMLKL